ncbi:MAG: DUF4234 domain-containing protein [Deltaproteobacteria bacterium]|nr:MAG: DUF4234 domain-containing protein [Deltaproteobacteria bacterium]TMQ17165.1 MAG: DUF4234 domain-containing protein [Deltaproteobacteria bacterium]
MTKRSIIAIILLTIVTFGIYHIYWLVKTKNEMVSMGADIPTGWLIIIPIANIYWMWKYSVGVEYASRGRMSSAVAFLLMFLVGYIIGPAIIQSTFNDIADQQARGGLPQARIA